MEDWRTNRWALLGQQVVERVQIDVGQERADLPLLANIALNSLDWLLHKHGCRFVRYADDFVVLCRTEAEVQEAHVPLSLQRAFH